MLLRQHSRSRTTWLVSLMLCAHAALGPDRNVVREKFAVERIPIPHVSEPTQMPFVEVVDSILAAKASDADAGIGAHEREIDRLVYGLYRLTADEVSAVEESIS